MKEKHLLRGLFLAPYYVFWAIVREIISIRLACSGAQEKKAGRQEEVTRSLYFTYVWSDPYRADSNQT